MKEQITIVFEDELMIVEGEILTVSSLTEVDITDSINASSIHAIQWANGVGHVEYKDRSKANDEIMSDDYTVWLAPFVNLWEEEKQSQENAQAEAEAEALSLYNSIEARAERVRTERDARITASDWVISRHAEQVALNTETTLSDEEYAAWLAYRQELRDLPDVEGFPWSGGGVDDEDCPWPVEP